MSVQMASAKKKKTVAKSSISLQQKKAVAPKKKKTAKKNTPKKGRPKAKTEERVLTAREKADAFIEKMSKSQTFQGKVQVRSARNFNTPFHLRRPTGIMSIDLALGGGFAAGGAAQVYGPKGSSKTFTAFKTAGQVQKNYGKNSIIALGMSEIRADVGFARMAGFHVAYSPEKIQEFIEIRENNGLDPFTEEELDDMESQIGEVMMIGGITGGDMLEGTIEVLREFGSACQLIIVDSLGSLLTKEQDKKGVADKHYGGSSGILTMWQVKVQPLFINDLPDGSCLETTILGINQVRALIGGPRPNMTRAAAGAKSWEHAQLANIEFRTGETLYEDSKGTIPNGKVLKWYLRKGKAGTHDGPRGEHEWYDVPDADPVFMFNVNDPNSTYGVNTTGDLVTAGKKTGSIEMAGAWMTLRGFDGEEVARAQGHDKFSDIIFKDEEIRQLLFDRTLDMANLTVRYK